MMALAVLGAAILALLVLIGRLKVSAFLALLVVSFAVGVVNGMSAGAALKSMLKGIGDTMGSLVLILVFGAILGKQIEESGAAHTITRALTGLFGRNRLQLSVMVTGLVVGLPMIYNASFLVLIPLVYTLAAETGLPLMQLGIPLSSALSVTHGYLPPHPAPIAIAALYGANTNRTLLYGLLLTPFATLLAGPLLARFFRGLRNEPPAGLYEARTFRPGELPGLAASLLTVSAPVLLMLAGAVAEMAWKGGGPAAETAKFLSDPNVALGLAAIAGFYTLGLRRGRDMDSLMKSAGAAVASVSTVILIIASGGAFKQVLLDGGTGEAIKTLVTRTNLSPLLLAWATAALLRLALGSATVAAITAAGILLPVVPGCGVAPELLVLATTAGSLMFSHFNDIGFWMFKEYYNVTVKQTFQIWTVMESIVAVVGLAGVLVINLFVPAPVPAAVAASKRVFYVNSYHEGYPSSDQAMEAIREILVLRVGAEQPGAARATLQGVGFRTGLRSGDRLRGLEARVRPGPGGSRRRLPADQWSHPRVERGRGQSLGGRANPEAGDHVRRLHDGLLRIRADEGRARTGRVGGADGVEDPGRRGAGANPGDAQHADEVLRESSACRQDPVPGAGQACLHRGAVTRRRRSNILAGGPSWPGG
jgi:Gnt-I system high-affinity gluconate transporter/Gnt-II system L-idonate transporter